MASMSETLVRSAIGMWGSVPLSLRAGNRWVLLNTVDVKAKVLLAMIRLGIRVGAIPEKRYEPIAARLVEIGKIVGGLKKTGGERPRR